MKTKRKIIISKKDHERLENLFFDRFAAAFSDKPYLQSLRGELDNAKIVAAEDVPPDVVTMNSTVRLRDTQTREVDTYTLVYPNEANIAQDKLSVLAPIGTAILGYRVGDFVRWQVPSGMIRVQIDELIFQPERDGIAEVLKT
ncbi:nucleoside diphosphate kinase regulator [uncultured Rubinisphaera sp.]|uniref:nucleoside diphosphate kinase regulator n=1 Tax=uncultured Rubinisphaera sp. TaxID=1678686 RepID=UPI000ED29FFE|nr:nucleoside diphosphate kinase regulator [Planctomycetaceae bacterium]|tara:strand:+ start:759 stop:1187 length:429 start_codon:yes stop_codon:yes gene_type:complete